MYDMRSAPLDQPKQEMGRSDESVKRAYSREFRPRTERRVALTIDRIPPTLFDAVKAKAKREGVSLRALILGWLKNWSAQEG